MICSGFVCELSPGWKTQILGSRLNQHGVRTRDAMRLSCETYANNFRF